MLFSYSKKIILFSAGFFVLAFLFFTPSLTNAQSTDDTKIDREFGLTETLNVGNVGDALRQDSPDVYAGQIIGIALSFLGVIFFILILYAGFRWMLAQGNESEVEKAKQIIIAAVSGLIIVLAAYAITAFIGSRLTS